MDTSQPSSAQTAQDQKRLNTRILPVNPTRLGKFSVPPTTTDSTTSLPLEDWSIELDTANSSDAQNLAHAAHQLKHSDLPVAFPTETVYGLGADATRSAAVKGIYHAKQRPSDNPLIVHIASLTQLRRLLRPQTAGNPSDPDSIPSIYHPLLRRFWPGPLTIILENPDHSLLAPEVTAGLSTFGARMPRNLLALALIKTADVPIAAPSANASTKPSPTAAEHVLYDLDGRIELILDGGLCDVGVESTVVDGLSSPPSILRPGGIGLEQIRGCEGWEGTVVGYKDVSEKGTKPRAPGMKYRHYSPKAPVLLVEAGGRAPDAEALARRLGVRRVVGVVRTKTWGRVNGSSDVGDGSAREVDAAAARQSEAGAILQEEAISSRDSQSPIAQMLLEHVIHASIKPLELDISSEGPDGQTFRVWDIALGQDTRDIARGLFSALRDLDQKDVDVIVVEGIDDTEGDIAAAVMNRLRKAAEIKLDQL